MQKCTDFRFPAQSTATLWIGLGQVTRTTERATTRSRRRRHGDKILPKALQLGDRTDGGKRLQKGGATASTGGVTTNPEASSQQRQLMPDSPRLEHPPPPPAPPPPPPPPEASPTPAESAAANAQPNLIAVKPTMIIKGVLGRYERWNPVHPTAGTFWGVGLGLGCGVGWGPGFGPEVIGYVGAGCGVGFSVGFTIAGVGIGLPQHGLIRNYDDSGFASNVSLDSARYYAVTVIKGLVWDAINFAGNAAAMRKESRQKLPRFQDNPPVSGGVDLPKLGKGVSSSIQSTVEYIKAFKDEH